MKKALLNLFALLLLPHGIAFGQKAAVSSQPSAVSKPDAPKPDAQTPKPDFEFTPLETARLDAARQKIYRFQDKLQEAFTEFAGVCETAKKDHHWPDGVGCNWDTLKATQQPPPTPPAPASNVPPPSPPVPAEKPEPQK